MMVCCLFNYWKQPQELEPDLKIMVEAAQGKCRCENQIYQIKPAQLVRNNLLVLAKGKGFLFQYLGAARKDG